MKDKACYFLGSTGEAAAYVSVVFTRNFIEFIQLFFIWLWDKSIEIRKKVFSVFRVYMYTALAPFVKFWDNVVDFAAAADAARRKKTPEARKKIYGMLCGNNEYTGLLPSAANIAAPVICVVFSATLVITALNTDYAVKLTVDGNIIGYIDNEQVFTDAEKIVDARISYFGGSNSTSVFEGISPAFEVKKSDGGEILSKYQVADKLIENSGLSIEYAYGFYIDDKFYGAVTDKTPVENAVNSLLSQREEEAAKYYGDGDVTVSFVDNVQYDNPGLYLSDSIVEPSEIISTVNGYKQVENFYEVKEGDTPSGIGEKAGLTLDELEKLNPGYLDEGLYPGAEIRISESKPILPVSVTRTVTSISYTDYSTKYVDDSSMYIGESKTVQEGEAGQDSVTYEITYEDEVEISRNVISTEHIKDPVDHIIHRGTKEEPKAKPVPNAPGVPNAPSGGSSGIFMRPIAYGTGYISTYYSAYAHRAIDIGCAAGTPIYAAGDGVVTVSGSYYSDYGKCIIIQHPNGLQTLYAHCSALHVSAGQRVSKGQFIGEVGQTGKARGNHLHFEVISGANKYDPLKYIA